MRTIKLTAVVDENHRLTIQLPDDVPTGEVEVTVAAKSDRSLDTTLTFEEAHKRLLEGGLLATNRLVPPDFVPMSDEEEDELISQLAKGRPMSEMVIEDREDRI